MKSPLILGIVCINMNEICLLHTEILHSSVLGLVVYWIMIDSHHSCIKDFLGSDISSGSSFSSLSNFQKLMELLTSLIAILHYHLYQPRLRVAHLYPN